MAEALRLAEQGIYSTTPNPRVGCVIVKDGVIVGRGAHIKAGEPHAEVHALREAGALAQAATAYVTLEPCSHFGRTPPCADALVKAGVSRVIAAMQDPNPQVAGNGLKKLQEASISVAYGLLEVQARELNAGFISRMTRQRPFVRSKIAASLDGRTALANGASQWITSASARQDVQHWRARSCAILTGSGTVQADNPQLLVRDAGLQEKSLGRQPLRVIVDSHLRTSPHAQVLLGGNVLIAHTEADEQRSAALKAQGASLLQLPSAEGQVCLRTLLKELAAKGVNELLVEAGQTLNGALLRQNLVDEYLLYLAPVLMGGDARGMFADLGLGNMQDTYVLDVLELRQLGPDIRIRVRPRC